MPTININESERPDSVAECRLSAAEHVFDFITGSVCTQASERRKWPSRRRTVRREPREWKEMSFKMETKRVTCRDNKSQHLLQTVD